MKVNFINKKKIKNFVGCALVGSLLAAPVAGLAQDYTIQPGDSLKRISQQFYGTSKYYDEIAFLNGIEDPSMIRAGDVIYLPNDYRELEFCGQDDKWVENDILYYTFGKKDTLWGLANRFYGDGMYWKCLAAYNGITNPKLVRDGKVIMIPPFSYLNMDALNWTFEGDSNTNTNNNQNVEVRGRVYTFQEGDTLWAIASEVYGSGKWWTELAFYNGIDNPRKISNGTVIELPDKQVLKDIREGNYPQDLYTISKNTYGTSRYAGVIAALNNVTNIGTFVPSSLFLPSLQDINVYYESDTFTYPLDGYYVVKKGDTFESIAELVYEDASLGSFIKETDGIDRLVEGMTIYIPAIYTYTK